MRPAPGHPSEPGQGAPMTRTRSSYALVVLLAALLAVAGVVISSTLAPPARAHAGLVDSDPADGSTIEAFDGDVVLTFSEEVRGPVTIVVTDPEGTGLQTGEPVVDGTEVRQSLDPAVTPGLHTIAYRVISADGHPITGQIRVTVEVAASEDEGPDATPTETLTQTPTQAPTQTPAEDLGEDPADDPADAADEQTDDGAAWWIPVGVLGALVAAGAAFVVSRRKKQ